MTHRQVDIQGSPAFISDEALPYEELVSGAVEMVRRCRATNPKAQTAREELADLLFPEVSAALPGVDPDVVCEVVLRVLSSCLGPALALGAPAEVAINTTVLGALKYAGRLK